MVVVYGRAGCAPCRTIKYWLDKKGISYKYIEGGAEIYPTLKINDTIIKGLNWSAINSSLQP